MILFLVLHGISVRVALSFHQTQGVRVAPRTVRNIPVSERAKAVIKGIFSTNLHASVVQTIVRSVVYQHLVKSVMRLIFFINLTVSNHVLVQHLFQAIRAKVEKLTCSSHYFQRLSKALRILHISRDLSHLRRRIFPIEFFVHLKFSSQRWSSGLESGFFCCDSIGRDTWKFCVFCHKTRLEDSPKHSVSRSHCNGRACSGL